MCSNNKLFFYLLLNLITIISSATSSITTADKLSTANLTTLRLVQVIARHGDRAPILPYPNDLYRDPSVYSINGWGELSELGAKQVFELGAYLRQRYDGFIPRKYRKRDFLMLSSDIDRAIMSAESNLAGFYELGPLPRSRDIFKEWQPVPIHTIPEDEDNLINAKAECPRHYFLFKQFLLSEEYASFLEENREFIDFVTENSGLAAISRDFTQIFQVQDALRCQHLHNLTLPSWVNSTVVSTLDHFKALSFVWNVKTEEMKRLKIGPMLKRLVGEMEAKVNASNLILNEDDSAQVPPYEDPILYRKMYVYSGHDSTISAILDSLNLFQPPHIPPYAAALIIELHKAPGSGEFYVELLYKNDTGKQPYKLDLAAVCDTSDEMSLPAAPSPYCSFQKFVTFLEKFIPTDWKSECQLQTQSNSLSWSVSTADGSAKKSKLLMKTAPAGNALDAAASAQSSTRQQHPLGMSAPGLPGFVLAVISLLASVVLLSLYLNRKPTVSSFRAGSAAYQNLR